RLHGVGIRALDPGDGPNHLRVRRDELLDVQPVLGGVAVLHAADLLADHRQGDGVPRGGKAGTVFHLLVPQNRDLLVHGLQQD
ncbi:IreB family regulatory phosphoprotein, partial [Dysosmobacter welbionis]